MPALCASRARWFSSSCSFSSTASISARSEPSSIAASLPVGFRPACFLGRLLLRAAMVSIRSAPEPGGQYAVDRADALHQRLVGDAFGIDQRIGVLAARAIEQLGDVELCTGETGGDLAHHVGHVGVGDGQAYRA